jgi:hypothetical protein
MILPLNLSASSLILKPEAVGEKPAPVSVFSGQARRLSGEGKLLDLSARPPRSAALRHLMRRDPPQSYPGAQDGGYSMAGIIGRNMLLPGLGQRRMGQNIRSRIYFVLEGAAWVGLGAFLWQHNARTDAYEEYAVAYAGVDGTGLSEDYYETIGNYRSSDGPGGYNEYVIREARDLYYPDQEAIEDYYEANSITGDDSWRWVTESDYNRYNSLRKGANSSERRAVYSLFFMLGLRLISNIDAVRTIMTAPDGEMGEAGGTSIDIQQGRRGISLALKRSA